MYKISSSMRFFFTVVSAVLWSGIYLTGFDTIHWLIYIPAVFFIFAAITRICPGIIISRMLFKNKTPENDADSSSR